jgi:hypothetical protein
LKNIVLINEGMWGGYYSIYRARKWIKTFLAANKKSRKNISEVGSFYHPNRVQIGFHIRRGDFKNPSTGLQIENESSIWNIQIPIEWYINVAEQLLKENGRSNIDFVLFTDSYDNSDIKDFIKNFNVINKKNIRKFGIQRSFFNE